MEEWKKAVLGVSPLDNPQYLIELQANIRLVHRILTKMPAELTIKEGK